MAIHQVDNILANMDDWNTNQHTKTGLLSRVQQSDITEAQAEKRTIDFLYEFVPKGKSPMCGNSICQDRRFLARCMPDLECYFHYRNLDVSTIKELTGRWAPEVAKGFNKNSTHLAMDDIRDSIAELKYYREHCFKI